MKRLYLFIMGTIISALCSQLYSQKLAVGFGSGLNLSDIHGTMNTEYWKTKPGPSSGVFAEYDLTRTLGLHAGVDYSTVYYESHPLQHYDYPIYWYTTGSMLYLPPPRVNSSNFSMLTLPLMLTVTIPSKPSLTLGAGGYYAFALDQYYDVSYYYYNSDDESLRNDMGYVYMMRLSYPIQERLELFVRGRYLTGRRTMTELNEYKHGYSDIAAGLVYNIGRNRNEEEVPREDAGSVNENIFITWRAGVVVSRNSGNVASDKYSALVAPSAGFSLNFRLSGTNTWFRTGISLERQGFSMRDSSDVWYRYSVNAVPVYYVDSKVSIDYAVIPALIDFHFGPGEIFSFNTGPYFAARLNSRCTGTARRETFYSGTYQLEETTIHDDITELIRRNDFGWIAGAGLTVPISGNTRLDISLQYRQGLPEVFNAENASLSDPYDAKDVFMRNSALTVQAGLRIPLFR